ncbi:Short-chain collagen C4 [Holothuria leucospilota]|uniref:Short-chain collagen C4 n=1 Tax=Holothuria leucospilota TaxID=206669 RepID=A0A9Q1CHV7_HOLLE|nr:Short-chain collagen C4 [Holothuria leucospilota]
MSTCHLHLVSVQKYSLHIRCIFQNGLHFVIILYPYSTMHTGIIMFLQINLIFLVMSVGCSKAGSRDKYDKEFEDMEDFSRIRRSTGSDDQTAQLPSQNTASSPFFMNPNIQASYFLGQCVMCPPGDPGPRGAPGPQGMPGRDGRDQLIIGPIGDHTYEPDATPPPATDTSSSSAGGVTYTRWGKTSCPTTSQLVYQGVMASGNDHTQKGSGVNYLCLPLEPTFADTPSYGNGGAWLYGVEYESNLFTSRDLHQSEAPCAVCLAANKETVLTIPGTNTCLGSQGWTLEYQGYLMSSHYTHSKSTFVCIDQNAEGIPRTTHNNNEPLFVGCSKAASRDNYDKEFKDMEDFSRVRRSTGSDDQTAQLPSQNMAGSPFFMNPNIQASYFLGQCVMCPPGDPGPRGAPGPQGMPGRDGRDQLIIGPIGDHTYEPDATPPPATDTSSSSAGGVTYTRWGKTSCPTTSQLVYQGVMASGNDYTHKGSGVNYLCLPLEPTFADTPSYGNGGAWLYGVEYESNLFTSRDLYQSEAPCAVCLAANKETVLTIPGTNTCLGSQGKLPVNSAG